MPLSLVLVPLWVVILLTISFNLERVSSFLEICYNVGWLVACFVYDLPLPSVFYIL